MVRITVGITLFNRLDYVKKMCRSLRHSVGLDNCSIRLYDDCSAEFTEEEVKKEFLFVSEYRRRDRNLGSDANIRQMYVDFLETGDDVLVNCDSDMIFREDWIEKLRELLPATDGVLTLYNSVLHTPLEYLTVGNEKLVQKETVGSAGTVFTRDIVQKIVTNVKRSYKYDWDWSRYLSTIGVRLLATDCSYLQHIGIVGQNCDAERIIDYGRNFFPTNDDTLQLNVSFFEQVVAASQAATEQKNRYYYFNYRVPKYRLLQVVIEPISLLKNRLKRLRS